MCEEEGPFEAAFILFANGTYGPMDQDLLGCLWQNGNSQYSLPVRFTVHLRNPIGAVDVNRRLTIDVACFAQCGAGYDNVHVPVFTENNCYFTNTPDAVTSSTADFTVLLLLSALRGSTYCERVAASGLWHKGLELTTDPEGLTLGMSCSPSFHRSCKDFMSRQTRLRGKSMTQFQVSLGWEESARILHGR